MSKMSATQQRRRFPSAEVLIAEACSTTGLSNFGSESFREGLGIFLDSLDREVNLTADRVDQYINTIRRRLTNRLKIEEQFRTSPELASLPIDGPVSIIGLPRTGTTALANIMSRDDEFRCLRDWEQTQPCPPPVLASEASDPRRLAILERYAAMARERPYLMAMHLYDADATSEDVEVLGLDFKSQQLGLPIFDYHAWWRDCDMVSAYRYHRRVTQLLQSRRPPNRWLFKAPYHKFHLEAFLTAYPDARFVMTHRDPAKAIPSVVSMTYALFPPGSLPDDDVKKVGRLFSEHLRIGMERAIAARARIGEHRFFDVYHRDFVRDPLGSLEQVYAFLGMELRPCTRSVMEAWHAANKEGAHGAHRYTAEDYGLSTEQLRSDYDFYIRRFDIPLDA